MKEVWSIKEQDGLVGITSNKSNWFIAESVLLKHAKLICDLFNASQPVVEADADCEECERYRRRQANYCPHCLKKI